jgi:hypothetical protein
MAEAPTAQFRCTACGRPADFTAADFLQGSGRLPKCPCQDFIECEDCDSRFSADMAGELAWAEHCVTDHPDD